MIKIQGLYSSFLHSQQVQHIQILGGQFLDLVKFKLFALRLLCPTQYTLWKPSPSLTANSIWKSFGKYE